ncbi:MAG: SNF2-related protein, partial [Neisseria sp.]|uniref:SNF2-related protein n=1 Tax=Neisseria sp. TaxID=192066 RepID=UPI0026DC1591
MQKNLLTPQQSQYFAYTLTRQMADGSVESLAGTLVDAQVDLNPHQVDAALFSCQNPLSKGVILADEVGLGKTIEAGLVILQKWAERKRKILIVVPANLRKQWHQELQDKFGLQGMLLEAKSYNALRKQGKRNPFAYDEGPVICSYQFAKAKAEDIKNIAWDLVVLDEAHRLRNVYKKGNVIAKTLKEAFASVHSKVLLTATPLQNSLLELYGLVSIIDERVFGDLDSFREQFGAKATEKTLQNLRQRLAPVCKRTLRRQVQPYVSYTARKAIVQEFTPSEQEQELSKLVADYLRRPSLNALPEGQRQLISLVLWKLLASSSYAIAGALGTMANRLKNTLESSEVVTDNKQDFDDYESLEETAEEWEEEQPAVISQPEYDAITEEIKELEKFKTLAESIRQDAKGQALLTALQRAFTELDRLGAAQKAIIFTESKRTQDYLQRLLAETIYAGENNEGIVLFNGSNSDAGAQRIYKNWLKKHEGSDRITGSKTADTRAALVEYFKEQGKIMIATEAGAEGINLQFCSLVINYDLPWNPQRIEQRIGRCHRYGQKHDVVVVNFVDRNNEADARVYELLNEKFQLFEGVFGASDEVLGVIGSGVDFERRIAEIYRHCRQPEEIKAGFAALQQELSGEINQAMVKTRQTLLENFDEKVHEKLRVRDEDSKAIRNKYERMLLDLTYSELKEHAVFDEQGFTLKSLPEKLSSFSIPIGHYELPRRSGDAHLYRITHPLAIHLLDQAKTHSCSSQKLIFDYSAYGKRVSTLEPYRGQHGHLILKLLTVEALGNREEHCL